MPKWFYCKLLYKRSNYIKLKQAAYLLQKEIYQSNFLKKIGNYFVLIRFMDIYTNMDGQTYINAICLLLITNILYIFLQQITF